MTRVPEGGEIEGDSEVFSGIGCEGVRSRCHGIYFYENGGLRPEGDGFGSGLSVNSLVCRGGVDYEMINANVLGLILGGGCGKISA